MVSKERLTAIDLLRGIVMVLMAIDHASGALNSGRFMRDSAWMWGHVAVVDTGQMLTRAPAHLCAPTFLFLAGVSIALSLAHRTASDREVDRHLFLRGLIIAAFDLILITPVAGGGEIVLQVLTAIGFGFWLMIPLRRLKPMTLALLATSVLVGTEALIRSQDALGSFEASPLFLTFFGMSWVSLRDGGFPAGMMTLYGLIPWAAILVLGFALGSIFLVPRLKDPSRRGPERFFLSAGVILLLIFFAIRAFSLYGDMGMPRLRSDIASWLLVSKYPPSVSFLGLTLGTMCLLLAALLARDRRGTPISSWNPLLVFGQTAFFFYILHFPLIELGAKLFNIHHRFGAPAAWIGGLLLCAATYPLCLLYRNYKSRHPKGWTRYL